MATSPDEVVVVYTTDDIYEAELIRNELLNVGIACELDGRSQGGFTEIVSTRLLVRASDAVQARSLIDQHSGKASPPPPEDL